MEMKAPPEFIAPCPKCGDGMLRRIVTKTNTSFYGCNNYDKGCCFTIPAVIAGKRLNARSVRELCKHQSTAILTGFHSKTGRSFDASLHLDDALRIVFDFPANPRPGG